jgi:hypothetical protein
MTNTTAYVEGQTAWANGTSLNPYQFFTSNWEAWELGWRDANAAA